MSDRAGITKSYTRHFLLDETKFRKIVDVLREHGTKLGKDTFLNFYVEAENDTYYETKDVEEVLADDNTPGKAISVLSVTVKEGKRKEPETIEGKEGSEKTLALVAFSRFKEEKIVYFTREKNRDWCILLADELSTQIQRILTVRPVPFLFSKGLDFPVFMLLGAGAIAYIFLIVSQLPPAMTLEEIAAISVEERTTKILELLTRRTSGSSWSFPIVMAIFALTMGVIEFRPLSKLLQKTSRSFFYWGDMIKNHDRFQRLLGRIKWGVVIAFLVSVVAGVVVVKLSTIW